MALTDYNFNPKGIAVNNPIGSTDLFPNKTLTPGSDGSLTSSSVIFPRIDENPLGYEDLNTLNAKYSFDLGGVTAVYRREMFPFQWMADFNAKPTSTGGDVHVQAEDLDQDVMFHDMMLNKLRLVSQGQADGSLPINKPLAINSSSNYGGKLHWRPLTTAAFADINALLVAGYAGSAGPTATAAATIVNKTSIAYDSQMYKAAANTGSSLENHMILPIGWSLAISGEGSRSAGGTDAEIFVTKLAALLEGNWYKKIGYDANVLTTAAAGQRIYGYIHESAGTNKPTCTVHAMFDDIAIKVDGSERQLHEVAVRLHGFVFTADYKEVVLLLDFNYANLEDLTLSSTAANNVVLLEEIKSSSTNFSGGFTRLSTHALMGMFITTPDPIAQGSDLGNDGNYHSGYLYDVESKQNFAQIIQSPKIKISGTYLASQNRLKLNQAQKMRDDMMMKFKQLRTNNAIYGPGATHKRNASGDMINTSAGFLCYQMNPIRYMRQTLNFSAAQNRLESIRAFVINYARALFAFQPSAQGNGVKQVLVSKWMMTQLDEYIKLGQQETGNIYGQYTGMQPRIDSSSIDLDIKYNRIQTPYGTLEFVVEPAFDYMTEMMLPGFVSTTNVNPKFIMMGVDKSKISTVSLRAPRLRGNIQTNSADFTMEDILCEETLEVLNPMSHAISLINIV